MTDISELDDMKAELSDRFGRLPRPVKCLLEVAELKIDASIWFVKAMQTEDNYIVLTYANKQRIEHLAKLHDRRLRVVDSQKSLLGYSAQERQSRLDARSQRTLSIRLAAVAKVTVRSLSEPSALY